MINKDRIVPITRTDLLSFFAAILNTVGQAPVIVLQVEDGAVTLPAGASGAYLAAEPIKALPEIGAGVALYFVPAYDFETVLTPAGGAPEFVANPGNIYGATSNGVTQLDTGAQYTAE